jgi:hypothetical protein
LIKETLWSFSNIAASNSEYAEAFVRSGALERVLYLTDNSNIDLKKEALWVICNAVTTSSPETRIEFFNKL